MKKGAPWLTELEAELLACPNSVHYDQIDSISQALAHQGRSWGWTQTAIDNLAKLAYGF